MIKQIQLRGISRAPSDRMTSDGGCAESMNMQVEEGELAPIPFPKDMSSTILGTSLNSQSDRYPIYFVHKLPNGQENFIGYKSSTSNNVTTTTLKAYVGGSMKSVGQISGTPTKFLGVGNTLIVYTADSPNYFLYKGTSYDSLGTAIPRPQIEIITRPSDNPTKNFYYDTLPEYFRDGSRVVADWNSAASDGDTHHADLLAAMSSLWDGVAMAMDDRRDDGIFYAPFFLRYALKLYDGSYIYDSVPILCGGWYDEWMYAKTIETTDVQTQQSLFSWKITLNILFKVRAKMASYSIGNWGDIVRSVDFFMSAPIYAPPINAGFKSMASDGTIVFDGMSEGGYLSYIRSEALARGIFYKVDSIVLDSSDASYTKLTNGTYRLQNSDEVGMGETLYVKEQLPYTYRTSNQYLAGSADPVNFNMREMLPGATEILTTGEYFLNGLVSSATSTAHSNKRYIFRYHLYDASGNERMVVSRGYSSVLGDYSQEPGYFTGDQDSTVQHFNTEQNTPVYASEPYGWIAYPDTRCKSVDVYYYESSTLKKTGTFAMSPHPMLECSYVFFGLGHTLQMHLSSVSDSSYSSSIANDENRRISLDNKLLLSGLENPFIFPLENIVSFNDKIIGVALTSVPLSEGQAGQFPLYVFTEGGIRYLETNSTGTFSTNTTIPNLARHVALPGTILGMEQMVVFVTKKGVMLLVGGSVECISDTMNGRHVKLDTGVVTALSNWSAIELLSSSVTDDTTFMAFMDGAKVAYDYNGMRLIFMKSGKEYHYVYMLKTRTWHKMTAEFSSFTILNSFPECLVANTSNSTKYMVCDYSTVLDDKTLLSDTTSRRFAIVSTRPFDLDQPDVRKTIKSLRIRGRFNRNDVQYLLLGSFDGINWKLLPSFRGGSYRMFRMVIISKLSPTERISWVDVDFEPRYANKLR